MFNTKFGWVEKIMQKILITGATGFIGRSLVESFSVKEFTITAAVRNPSIFLSSRVKQIQVGDLLSGADWSQALQGVDIVIHLAARAHILSDNATDPLAEFRKINTAGTLKLASQAASKGVSRFIFISSIGVNGNQTTDFPFTEEDSPQPAEPYAISKYEAEIGLLQIAVKSSMEIVTIRPPLVYGPNAPGNFGRLLDLVARGIPLPLGLVRNMRSFVAIDNLIDLIITCIERPAAANQTFLVSDGEDLSTTDLLRRISFSLGKPALLVPVPQQLLSASLSLLGKDTVAQRLCGSLQVDIGKAHDLLGWAPPLSVDRALSKVAQAYLDIKQ